MEVADDEWPPGSSLVVLDQPYSEGGGARCASLLAGMDPATARVLTVSYTQSTQTWLKHWNAHVGPGPAEWHAIRIDDGNSAPTGPPGDHLIEGGSRTIERIANPADLTGLGLAIRRHRERSEEPGQLTLCLHSLTGMLQFVSANTVYRFVHWLTGQVRDAEGLAHFHLDPEAHEQRILNQFFTLFDGRIEAPTEV